jgi:hypothetical protein
LPDGICWYVESSRRAASAYVAGIAGVSRQTIHKWVRRFRDEWAFD